jgi:hypothetical protein
MTRTIFFRARRRWALAAVALLAAGPTALAGGAVPAMADPGPAAAAIARIGSSGRAATVGTRYADRLRVLVLDSDGKPVQGASVSFTLASSAAGPSATSSAGATFADGGGTQATALTDAVGRATSPAVMANTTTGSFAATAELTGGALRVGFSLRNRAGRPVSLSAGVAASASAVAGTRFPIRLAVTVADAYGNPVPGAVVMFSAPLRGPSGRFAGGSRRARVRTGGSGKAVAPAFRATSTPGGYVVRATAAGAAPAAFALVNTPAGDAL